MRPETLLFTFVFLHLERQTSGKLGVRDCKLYRDLEDYRSLTTDAGDVPTVACTCHEGAQIYRRHLNPPEWDDIGDMLLGAPPLYATEYLEKSEETYACVAEFSRYDPILEEWEPEAFTPKKYPNHTSCMQFDSREEAVKELSGFAVEIDGAYTEYQVTADCECVGGKHVFVVGEDKTEFSEIAMAGDEAFKEYIDQPDVVCVKGRVGERAGGRDVGDRGLSSYPNSCPTGLETRLYSMDIVLHPSWWLQLHIRNARGVQLWELDCVKGRYHCPTTQSYGFERQQLRMSGHCTRRLHTITVYMCGSSDDTLFHMYNHPPWLWTHYGMVKHNDDFIFRLCPRAEGANGFRVDGKGERCDVYLEGKNSFAMQTSMYKDDFCKAYWS